MPKNREKLKKLKYKWQRELREIEATIAYDLDVFGDHLAEREGYKVHDGIDALHFYLIQKHHWLPSQARALNLDDLRFLFAEEMSGWDTPKAAR
jgi:hypothetical protein